MKMPKYYEVEGWYRYGNNEKDFEKEIIIAMNTEDAIEDFKRLFNEYNFFKVHIKEIQL